MLAFLTLIAAAVLIFAGPWFTGQVAVGIALAVIAVVFLVLPLLVFRSVSTKITDAHRSFFD